MALLTKESLWLSGRAASEGGIRRSEVRFLIGLVTWRKTTFLYNALQNPLLHPVTISLNRHLDIIGTWTSGVYNFVIYIHAEFETVTRT